MSHTLKSSEAGEMHSITLGGITTYHIFTKAGYFRGGKIYFADKIFRVLSGEVECISCSSLNSHSKPHHNSSPQGEDEITEIGEAYSLSLRRGGGGGVEGARLGGVEASPDKGLEVMDIHEILTPESGEKIILAGTAHIFRAKTDCVFTESFPENTKSEEYERYRAMKT